MEDEVKKPMGWKELYLKEDWWAIYVGFGIALLCLIAFLNGSTFAKAAGAGSWLAFMVVISF